MGSRNGRQARGRQAQQQRRAARKLRRERPALQPSPHVDSAATRRGAENGWSRSPWGGADAWGDPAVWAEADPDDDPDAYDEDDDAASGSDPWGDGVRRSTRAERARRAAAAAAPPPPTISRAAADAQAWALLQKAAGFAEATRSRPPDSLVVDLAVFDSRVPAALAGIHVAAATARLVQYLQVRYETGWQPADVVHGVGRHSKSRAAGELVQRVIAYEASGSAAYLRAPLQWIDQLPPSVDPASWELLAGFSDPLEGWATVAQVLGALWSLPPMPQLITPPSAWDKAPRHTATRPSRRATDRPAAPADGRAARKDPKMLARIRALLAKAEATEFAQEAEAFTGKAQELMARYAIDEALLIYPSARVDVHSRRIHVEDPYAEQKAILIDVCAKAQHCKSVWSAAVAISTVVGPPTELDLTDMLYTSLLVQAVRAMTEAGRVRSDRSPSFRRAFLTSYATRIAERLQDSNSLVEEQVAAEMGAELVPVRARMDAAVSDEFDRLFPHTVPGRSRSFDARGWHAGRAAADEAVFTRGRLES